MMKADVFVQFSPSLSWKQMLLFATSYLSCETIFSSVPSLLLEGCRGS